MKRNVYHSLLVHLLVVLVVASIAIPGPAVSPGAETNYIITQGDRCMVVHPVAGEEDVESFYDYRNEFTDPSSYGYSSYGTMEYQENDTSAVFLYEGPEGVSLVSLHDRYGGDDDNGTAGGSVTFNVDGLPESGEWVVLDDTYEGQDDIYDIRETSAELNWVWQTGRNDGAVFRGLDRADDLHVTIDPAFNLDANVRYGDNRRTGELDRPDANSGYNGTIDEWHVLSAADGGVERIELDSLDEPITITRGDCSVDATVDGNDDAATVAADGFRGGELLIADFDGTLEGDGVRLERFEAYTTDPAESIELNARQVGDEAPPPGEFESDGYAVEVGGHESISTVNYTLSVDAETLERWDTEPDELRVYSIEDGVWNGSETTVESDGDRHRYTASAPAGTVIGLGVDKPVLTVDDISTDEFTAGDSGTIAVDVVNHGGQPGEIVFDIDIDGETVQTHTLRLDPGERTTVTVDHEFDEAGSHTVTAGDQSETIEVAEDDSTPGFGPVAAIIALALAVVGAMLRKRS
ncbi:PGF-CTERM sorting domain-containing protein (plasmid) [Haloferacaceae archaeon DSL9]